MVTLATAHPAKFPDAVEAAIGQRPALPRWLADLFDQPERKIAMPNDLAANEIPYSRAYYPLTVQTHRLQNGFRIVTENMPGLKSASMWHLGECRWAS